MKNITSHFPQLNLNTSDVKQHARNLLVISKWFNHSIFAQSLQLTTALELVAKIYGVKSYAALKVETKDLQLKPLKTLIAELSKTNEADLLFLTTAHDYLGTYQQVAKKIPVYAEPSALLLKVIENFKHGRENKLFENLATLNAIGMKVFHQRNILDGLDVDAFNNCTNGALHAHLECYRIFNSNDVLIDTDWLLKTKGCEDWVELNLLNINRPIAIEQPQYKEKDLAKALGCQKIISFEINSSLFDQIELFTQEVKPTYKLLNAFSRDEPTDSEGVYCEYASHWAFKNNPNFIANGVVEIHDYVDAEIKYINHSGVEVTVVFETQFFLALGMTESGFRIDRKMVTDGNPSAVVLSVNQLIFDQTIKALEAHQYVLANIWSSVGALFSIEETEKSKLAEKKAEILEIAEDEWLEKHQSILYHLSDHFEEDFLDMVFSETKGLNPISDQTEYNAAFYSSLKNPEFKAKISAMKEAFIQERTLELSIKKAVKS